MNDQWIIRRTALSFICFFRCLLVQCIRPQSVNCLCWECNKSSFSDNLSRFSYCIFVYLVFVYFLNYRFHSFHYTIFLISAQHISGFHCRFPGQAIAFIIPFFLSALNIFQDSIADFLGKLLLIRHIYQHPRLHRAA